MKFIERLTGFDAQKNVMRTEVIAGLTTFLTMSYILAVNPAILGQAGMDKGAVFTATAITSAVATILMAIVAKLPFGLAPSMSINAFFTFTLVMGMGYSWQMALTCVLIEGILFLLITACNVQKYLLMAIPVSQRHAISAGIGIFIAFIGLKNAGLVVSSQTTLVQLGKITPATLLAFATIILAGVLLHRKVIGGLFISIIVFTLIGIPSAYHRDTKGIQFCLHTSFNGSYILEI
jgi:AGZA family xanthine/uracil permease-like MFS transporter